MGLRTVLGFLFFLLVVLLLVFYWFVPFETTEFIRFNGPKNFEFNSSNSAVQFYNNMRFADNRISYSITDCPLSKKDEMRRAFDILEAQTILDFYPTSSNSQIEVTCDSSEKIEGGLFIAGEGGPTNITQSGEFNVISSGQILLIRESSCSTPNVPVHELLHVLGFDHVENPGDIMYPISKCDQEISPVTIRQINELYSVPNYPDLVFEDVSAVMKGKYLNTNLSVRNNGLAESPSTTVEIYADDDLIKEVSLDSLKIGHGRVITLTNVWISKLGVDEFSFKIKSNFDELKKENNEARLVTKN